MRAARLLVVAVLALGGTASAAERRGREVRLDGYLEWRKGPHLVVDGQRVRASEGARFKGHGDAKSLATIPLGYELRVKGRRQPDGVLVAHELEARPNGMALWEDDVLLATNQAEENWLRAREVYEEDDGGEVEVIGPLRDDGPRWERARGVVNRLLPPYLSPDDVRVYLVENEEWNAFAMGNYALFVHSGLLDAVDDDELAVVLGHELAHATHEHSRRQAKKDMWTGLAAAVVGAAAEEFDDDALRGAAKAVAFVSAALLSNKFSRDYEDQADRVGLRYAYEGGYDVAAGPRLWHRFAQKYGDPGKVANLIFGDHSRSSERIAHLTEQIAWNYEPARGDAPVRAASGGGAPPALGAQEGVTEPARTVKEGARALVQARKPAAPEVRLGMTEAQVLSRLGKPQEALTDDDGLVHWVYPRLRVVFEDSRVVRLLR